MQLEHEEPELLTVLPEASFELKPKTDNRFLMRRLLQLGQVNLDISSDAPTSSSKEFPHFKQSNSNIGMVVPHQDLPFS